MKYYVQVVLAQSFPFIPDTLTYSFDDSKLQIQIGDCVKAPFGKKELDGIVVEFCDLSINNPYKSKIREIIAIRNEKIQSEIIHLCKNMAKYYFCSLSSCIRLFFPQIIWNRKYEEEYKTIWKISAHEIPLLKGVKQQNIIQYLQKNKQTEQSLLLQETEASLSTLKGLEDKNIVKKQLDSIFKNEFLINKTHLKKLNEEQKQAFESLKTSQKSLIHGITGSGKTEIFLHFLVWIFENNKEAQSLILVPEIALTPQIIQYFQKIFPHKTAVIHSKVSDKERVRIWHEVQKGEIKLIIGSRSALFLPWKNLQAIIIDEEHEWTYKSDKTPRYHVKWVAENMINFYKNSHLILASATPDVQSYYYALHGDYNLFELKNRAIGTLLPKVRIIDMKEEFLRKNFSPISEELDRKIKETLAKNKQIILFLNKRGFSQSIQCKECGEIVMCPHCDVPMTKHQNEKTSKLICHYCFLVKEIPKTCPRCHSYSIQDKGLGTQKIEQELQVRYPKAIILRADKDTTTGKDDFEKIYQEMKDKKADILLGTQMIAKGLDLENVELVGVISADSGLHIPDFRSSEKVFQLLTQVAGRSGRHTKGEVVFQTFQPHHEIIQAASMHSYKNLYNQEIETRKLLNYPPFSALIKLTFTHPDKTIALKTSNNLYKHMKEENIKNSYNLQIRFAPSFIPKMHGKYYFHIILQGKSPEKILEDYLKNTPKLLNNWRIDRDPIILC